ncbi:MAG: aromatic amino acid transaminase [Kiritimatiellae bacterium]|nr:aromatic amino acid transaminase [Kiritimatiellia bacterium]
MGWPNVEPAPPDPILGLTEAWRADPNPRKVNLGVGVFQDEQGRTPVLASVKAAETALVAAELTKNYWPIAGDPEYGRRVAELIWGADGGSDARLRVMCAPGGTGALRVGAELVGAVVGRGGAVWLSRPTWPNHRGIFTAAGFAVREYPYFEPAGGGVDRGAMWAALEAAGPRDVVVLHAGCHNPTGADLEPEDWQRLAAAARERGWLPVVDAAYLGFGGTLQQDAAPLRELLGAGVEFLAAISFSKNMGLYRDRVGALAIVAADGQAAEALLSHARCAARVLYSNPPAHGPQVAMRILADRLLREMWTRELDAMRERIARARAAFADGLAARLPARDWSFIRRQRGMFSFTGLSRAHTEWLREHRSIYMTADGRANVVGLNPDNLDYVCDAIAEALRERPAG